MISKTFYWDGNTDTMIATARVDRQIFHSCQRESLDKRNVVYVSFYERVVDKVNDVIDNCSWP